MSDTSSSSLTTSASSSSSLSTSTTIPTSSSTSSTTLGIPPPLTSSDSSTSTASTTSTTSTTTELTDTSTSSSTTDTTPSITTISSTSTPLTLTTPTTTSPSTSTTVAVQGPAAPTLTSVVVVPAPTQTPSRTAAPSSSNGFFENKGAVAGVFTVVGLIIFALLIVLLVTIFRRRRAQQFDREVEAAAAEAAAAPAPHFLDDDDDHPYRRPADQSTAYVDHPQYSDISSHGTYSQPALGSQEAYGMRDLGSTPGELFNNPYATGGAAGAAGVGVARARSTRDPGAFASGFQDGATPYPAFAGPAAFHSGAYGIGGGQSSFGAGVGAGVGAGMQRGMSLNHHPNADYAVNNQEFSQGLHPGQYLQQSDLARNPSQVAYNTTHARSTPVGSSASPPLPKEQPPYAANYASAPVQEVGEGAYGGYTDDLEGAGLKKEDRQSYLDDDEDEARPKILKVANE